MLAHLAGSDFFATYNKLVKKMFCLFEGKPKISLYGLTHVGRVRQNNEDNFTICSNNRVAVVADGMGGHACGEVASELAVKTFFDASGEPELLGLPGADGDTIRHWLLGKVEQAHQNVLRDQRSSPGKRAMGSTIAAMCYFNDEVHIAHVGDSRAYMLREKGLYQLTRDHSYVEELFRKGLINRQQADEFPSKNVIVRALGMEGACVADHVAHAPRSGNVLLLCSDGLCGHVPGGEIEKILRRATKKNVAEICQDLVDLALRFGGPDNITVVVAVFH